MTPFVPASLPDYAKDPAFYRARFNVGAEEAVRMARRAASDDVFLNDTYQVNRSKIHEGRYGWPDFVHLSIKRIDKEPVRDWADMQQIKNELVGPEHEGMEIFPAESRLVDMANQYHIWCFVDASLRIPMGWEDRMVGNAEEAEKVGAKQRVREYQERMGVTDEQSWC